MVFIRKFDGEMKPKDRRKLHWSAPVLWCMVVLCECFSQLAWGGYYKSIQWTPQNPKFQFPKEQILDGRAYYRVPVLLNNRLAIVCPNPSTYLKFVETQVPRDQLYESIWYVDRGSFYTCQVGIPKNQGVNKRWMNCDTPSALKYGWLSFTSLNAENDFSFVAGTEHYFIATSNGSLNSLDSKAGGHCNNTVNGVSMKLVIYICYNETDPECKFNPDTPTQSVHNVTCSNPDLASGAFRLSPSNNVWHFLTIVFGIGFSSCLVVISLCIVFVCRRTISKRSREEKDNLHPNRDENDAKEVNTPIMDTCSV